MTEDEMVGWCHELNGHDFEKTLGDSEGQGSLVCSSPWDSPGKKTGGGCHALFHLLYIYTYAIVSASGKLTTSQSYCFSVANLRLIC